MAKYKEIARVIRQRILSMEYPLNTPLPNQENLAKEFHTSRVTIQKALQLLAIEGLVLTSQGSGTYVRKNTLANPIYDISFDVHMGLTQRVSERERITNKTISFTVRFPNEEECDKLLLDKASPIYDIVRLRLLDGQPFIMEYTKMPVKMVPDITEDIIIDSIYAHIKETLKLKIGGANRRITADRPNQLEIEHLECNENDPMLEVEQVVCLTNGIPFEYSHTRCRYDKRGVMVISIYN